MDIHGENAFKIKSYSNAAYTLDRLNDPLVDMTPAQIASIRGIGDAIAQKIVDLLATKKLQILEDYIEKTPAGILEMLKIKGLGPKKIITTNTEEPISNIPLKLMGPPIYESELVKWCLENIKELDQNFLNTALMSALSKTLNKKGFAIEKQRLHRSNLYRLKTNTGLIKEGAIIIKEE
jgi:DNA polymerase/3'-5' exonuclease PolX